MAPGTVTPHLRTTRASQDQPGVGPRQPETAAIPSQDIGVVQFTRSLLHMSRPRIELQVAVVRARRTSPDDDVTWWEATMALDRSLRSGGPWHEAAMAAHLASQAVLAAASRTGPALSPDVTAVARSAGEVARVLVAGDLNTTAAGYLVRGWEDLLVCPAERDFSPALAGGRRHRTSRTAAHQPRRGRRP